MKLRIAGSQVFVRNDSVGLNYDTINRAIDFAIDEKADILLTPEGSLSGYHNRFNQSDVEDALNAIVSKAGSHGLGLALGTCFYEKDGLCYNQSISEDDSL